MRLTNFNKDDSKVPFRRATYYCFVSLAVSFLGLSHLVMADVERPEYPPLPEVTVSSEKNGGLPVPPKQLVPQQPILFKVERQSCKSAPQYEGEDYYLGCWITSTNKWGDKQRKFFNSYELDEEACEKYCKQ